MRALIPQTITVPAAAGGQPSSVKIAASGLYFFCLTATNSFQLQFDASNITTVQPGMNIPGSFSRLTFYNASAAAISVTFYTSQTPIEAGAVTVAAVQNSLATCLQASIAQALVTVATAGTPVPFNATAGSTFARTIIAIGQKTIAPATKGGSANTGNVYVGGVNTADHQPLPIIPTGQFVFQADTGAKFDLNNFWLDADNNGDGLVIIFW